MRVKIRSTIDVDAPINLRRLEPIDKIKAGVLTQWKNTNMYKKYKKRQTEAAFLQQIQRDENVKSYLLSIIYSELNKNETLKSHNVSCESIVIEIKQEYEESLARLFPTLFNKSGDNHKDFLSFDIERIPENADLRRAFKDMPILLRCSKKKL